MTEVRMKNLFRMHIHINVWLGLSLEVVKDQFLVYLLGFNFARGILKIELKQKTYNLFSLCHP